MQQASEVAPKRKQGSTNAELYPVKFNWHFHREWIAYAWQISRYTN